jgi:hypothetical protein
MASTINGTSTGNGGLISTGDDSGILNIQTNETTAITVDASQNVGIGTTSPSYKLHVVSSSASTPLLIDGGTNTYFGIKNSSQTAYLGAVGTVMYFENNGSERMRIDSSGNLLVGTTSSSGSFKVETSGKVKAETGFVTGSGGGLGIGADATNNTFYTSSLGSGSTTMYIGNKSINTTSDSRIKDNIKPTERNAIELLNQWEVVDHTWNDPSDTAPVNRNSRGVWTGVIAQQIINSTPWLVNAPDKDCPKCSVGEHCDEHDSWWQVDFEYAVPLLVKAIQELKAINDTQAETINALTARIVALESK